MARQRRKQQAPDPKTMRAWRAVRTFEAMIPQLQHYVRAVTGNPTLKVRATAGTSRTDGRTIFIQPPARLGDDLRHNRDFCHRRDATTLRQMCEACDVSDMIDAGLYHETAHILFGTLEDPTPAGLKPIRDLVAEWHPSAACDHAADINRQLTELMKVHKESYVLHANLFSPVLGILLNCFEDARVNVAQFDYRPGTRASLTAHAQSLMSNENQDDEDWMPWHERDINSQVLIGMFLVASEEFGYVDMLAEEARQIIWQNDMDSALTAVGRAGTVHDTVQVTVDIFRSLQEMGVMVLPKCQVPDLTPPQSQPEDQPEQGEPEEDNDASSDRSGDGANPPSADGKGDKGTGGQGSKGDDRTPEGSKDSDGQETERVADDGGSSPIQHGPSSEVRGTDEHAGEPDTESSGPDLGGGEEGPPDQPEDAGDGGETQSGRGDEVNPSGHDDGDDVDSGEGDQEEDSDVEPGQHAGAAGDGTDGADDSGEGGADPDGDGDGDGVSSDEVSGSDDEDSDLSEESNLLDEEALEALRATAQRMSLHAMLAEELPDADTEEFACGHSELHAEEVDDDDEFGWGDANADGEIEALIIAIMQAEFFETPSSEVVGVTQYTYPSPEQNWQPNPLTPSRSQPETYMVGEDILGQVTTAGRIAFDVNKRRKHDRNRRSGKINTRVLGRRAPLDDDRLFHKMTVPAKRDYYVVITMDCSGSQDRVARGGKPAFAKTVYGRHDPERRIDRMKRAVFAQAEVLTRLGVPFELWAHTADWADYSDTNAGSVLQMHLVKDKDTAWTDEVKVSVANVGPAGGNLDGHTLEFVRKRIESSRATNRILIYYTDGAMPAMNADEEGEILLRETAYCRKAKIDLLAVGIQSNSPAEWGFDTVEVNGDEDLIKVMEQIERTIT